MTSVCFMDCFCESRVLALIMLHLDCTTVGLVTATSHIHAACRSAQVRVYCQLHDGYWDATLVRFAPGSSTCTLCPYTTTWPCANCRLLVARYELFSQLHPAIHYFIHQVTELPRLHSYAGPSSDLLYILTESLFDVATRVLRMQVVDSLRRRATRPDRQDLDLDSLLHNLQTIDFATSCPVPLHHTRHIRVLRTNMQIAEDLLMSLLLTVLLPKYWYARGKPIGISWDQHEWLPKARHNYTREIEC